MKIKFNFFRQLGIQTALLFLCTTAWAQTDWKPLFNGKDLSNWEVKNGTAPYHIEDNAIVGTSKTNTPNTFLCTKKMYSDFILELEVYVAPGLNSGIQFRSNSLKDYKNGRVHGYQSELDTSKRAWSGGIFDEGRRGWLYPLTINPTGGGAFNNGEWNKVRIEAIGNSIKTFINGIQCTNMVDDMTAKGFIALQVHSIKDQSQEGKTIQWKNIRIVTENLDQYQSHSQPYARQVSYLSNTLTDEEKRKGWRLLWDGKTSKGWKSAKKDGFPKKGWVINDGVLTVMESGGGEARNGGDIVTIDNFSNFELEIDFKFTPGANSGIKYFVDTSLNKGLGSSIGCEFQILDDKLHPDAKKGVKSNRTLASLYDLIRSESLQEPRTERRSAGPNSWHRARIIVDGSHVEHWLNNMKVVEYDRHSQMFKYLVYYSKYAKYPGFGTAAEGKILLQDHGNTVSFKNLKVREF
ncbi:MAG: DUF1080 domain-containing protein [Flavobacteriaceae bacterium]|jgi:hypothetical protein